MVNLFKVNAGQAIQMRNAIDKTNLPEEDLAVTLSVVSVTSVIVKLVKEPSFEALSQLRVTTSCLSKVVSGFFGYVNTMPLLISSVSLYNKVADHQNCYLRE